MKWALVALIVSCNAAGDLLNSAGMKRHGEVKDFRPAGIARLVASVVRNRYVISGIALMGIAFFGLISLMSISELSFAVPATASSYLIETILARLVLRERINRRRWIGATLVTLGVALLDF
ncbi:MAG TPA: EamA family transporter [Bryobacteraceae bacterium]|jgi:drug/metabolite transporter (DMT)-like permease|nr:EamA family transporter [Bryobacteraceae bacterium]